MNLGKCLSKGTLLDLIWRLFHSLFPLQSYESKPFHHNLQLGIISVWI